jgi:hypothetical protein
MGRRDGRRRRSWWRTAQRLQDDLPVIKARCEGAAAGFNGPDPLADSGLFLAEQGEVDGVGVVGLQQLAPLTLQAQQFTVQLLELVGGLTLAGIDLSLEGGVQLAQPPVGKLDSFVELFDLAFQPVGGDVGSRQPLRPVGRVPRQ